jgi:dephospho-CoA kinase
VAAEFARHGARVISGDEAGHEALRQPDIRARIVERWGPRVLDEKGAISRRAVGQIVFADAGERRALEAIVFPYIERRLREQIAEAAADPGVALVVLDAAILLEAGWNNLVNQIVYVHAPRDVRLKRLAEHRGWTEKEVAARENAQMPLSEKMSRADAIVDNSGSLEEVAQQIDELLAAWGLTHAPSA